MSSSDVNLSMVSLNCAQQNGSTSLSSRAFVESIRQQQNTGDPFGSVNKELPMFAKDKNFKVKKKSFQTMKK